MLENKLFFGLINSFLVWFWIGPSKYRLFEAIYSSPIHKLAIQRQPYPLVCWHTKLHDGFAQGLGLGMGSEPNCKVQISSALLIKSKTRRAWSNYTTCLLLLVRTCVDQSQMSTHCYHSINRCATKDMSAPLVWEAQTRQFNLNFHIIYHSIEQK